MITDKLWQAGRRFPVDPCEGRWQLVQGAREQSDVLGIPEVGDESDLCGLLLEIPAELASADAAAQGCEQNPLVRWTGGWWADA